MAKFIDLNVNNPASGSAELNSGANETENKIQRLLKEKIPEKPSEDDVSLDSINSVVGNPTEMNVPLNFLIDPPEKWMGIFKKASKDEVKKMATSIYSYGLLHRITLWQTGIDSYVILGGMTRAAAFKYLHEITSDEKWSTIPAKVYTRKQLDEIDAERIFIISNTDQRQMSVKGIANAYYNLVKLEKQKAFYGSGIYAREAAAKQTSVSRSSFGNYLRLTELFPPLLDEIDAGNLQMMSAYELSFIPKVLQQYIFDNKLYFNLKRNIAKKIRKEAESAADIDRIIADKDKVKEFNYSIKIGVAVPKDCEILPLFVDKKNKDDIVKILKHAINSSDFSDDIKNALMKTLES